MSIDLQAIIHIFVKNIIQKKIMVCKYGLKGVFHKTWTLGYIAA